MDDFIVLAEGFSAVRVELQQERFSVSSDLQDKIEQIWQEQSKRAPAKGQELTNNQICRIKHQCVKDSILYLDLQPTDYRHFVGLRHILDAANCANPISVGGITITDDDYIVLGRKGRKVELGAGQVHIVPSGYVDLDDVAGRGGGVGFALARELAEETGSGIYKPIALIDKKDMRQPMLVYKVRMPFKKAEVEAMFDTVEREFSELLFYKNTAEGVANALAERGEELRSHARGALTCYLRRFSQL